MVMGPDSVSADGFKFSFAKHIIISSLSPMRWYLLFVFIYKIHGLNKSFYFLHFNMMSTWKPLDFYVVIFI